MDASVVASSSVVPARRRHASTLFLVAGTLGALVIGWLASLGFSTVDGPSKISLMLPVIAVGGCLAVALAVRRFEYFVLLLVAIRAGLDAARSGSGSLTVAVAAIFVLFSLAWLAVQRATRNDIRVGLLTRASVCFVVAAGLTVATSDRPSISLQEWTRLLSAMMMIIVLERLFVTHPRSLPRLLFAAYVSFAVPALLGAYQKLTHRGLNYSDGLGRVRGSFAHPNSFAMYLAFLIVMGVALLWATHRWYRWGLVGVLLVAFAMLYSTQTRGAWIGTVIGILVVVGLKSRRTLAIVLIAMVAIAALPPVFSRFHDLSHETRASGVPANSLVWRLEHWKDALILAESKPVTGIGLKMVETESPDGKLPHNDYVRSYVEGGVLGLLTYLGLLAAFAVTAVRAVRRARDRLGQSVARGFAGCVAALVLISASDNLITQSVVLWYFALFAAAASAVASRRVQNQPVEPTLETV